MGLRVVKLNTGGSNPSFRYQVRGDAQLGRVPVGLAMSRVRIPPP